MSRDITVKKVNLTALKKIADKAAERIAKSTAREAQGNYRNAYYDGPLVHLDSIKVNAEKKDDGRWQIVASGYAVSFVEFGTGAVGDGSYKGNAPSWYHYDAKRAGAPSHIKGNKGWYFRAEQELANEPTRAYRYYRGVDEYGDPIPMPERMYKGQATSGKTGFVKESKLAQFKASGGKVLAEESLEHFFERKRRDALKSGALVKEETDDVYYTEGIVANNCLFDALEETKAHIVEIAKGTRK